MRNKKSGMKCGCAVTAALSICSGLAWGAEGTDPLTAAVAASALYNRASEQAERDSHGPGSFQTAFLDALWNTTAQAVAQSPITADAA